MYDVEIDEEEANQVAPRWKFIICYQTNFMMWSLNAHELTAVISSVDVILLVARV